MNLSSDKLKLAVLLLVVASVFTGAFMLFAGGDTSPTPNDTPESADDPQSKIDPVDTQDSTSEGPSSPPSDNESELDSRLDLSETQSESITNSVKQKMVGDDESNSSSTDPSDDGSEVSDAQAESSDSTGASAITVQAKTIDGTADIVAESVRRSGGKANVLTPTLVEVTALPAVIRSLADQNNVFYIRDKPTPQTTQSDPTGGPIAIGADHLHNNNVTGKNTTVLVIDSEFNKNNGELQDNVVDTWGDATHFNNGGDEDHGTLSATVVARTAPDADLILATWADGTSVLDILDRVQTSGRDIDVITMSSSFPPLRLDGESALSNKIDETTTNTGAVFVTSSGNGGDGNHYHELFESSEAGGYMQFDDGTATLGLSATDVTTPGGQIYVATNTSTPGSSDYRMEIVDSGGSVLTSSNSNAPYASFSVQAGWPNDIAVRVRDSGGNGGHEVHVFTTFTESYVLDTATRSSSLLPPGTSPHTVTVGAMDVGTTEDETTIGEWEHVEPYSSHGPTVDGRPGVTIMGPACVLGERNFCGTSSSAPFVGGSLALMNDAQPNVTANQEVIAIQRSGQSIDGYPSLTAESASPYIGYGKLDAQGAISSAQSVNYDPSLGNKQLEQEDFAFGPDGTSQSASEFWDIFARLTTALLTGLSTIGVLLSISALALYFLGYIPSTFRWSNCTPRTRRFLLGTASVLSINAILRLGIWIAESVETAPGEYPALGVGVSLVDRIVGYVGSASPTGVYDALATLNETILIGTASLGLTIFLFILVFYVADVAETPFQVISTQGRLTRSFIGVFLTSGASIFLYTALWIATDTQNTPDALPANGVFGTDVERLFIGIDTAQSFGAVVDTLAAFFQAFRMSLMFLLLTMITFLTISYITVRWTVPGSEGATLSHIKRATVGCMISLTILPIVYATSWLTTGFTDETTTYSRVSPSVELPVSELRDASVDARPFQQAGISKDPMESILIRLVDFQTEAIFFAAMLIVMLGVVLYFYTSYSSHLTTEAPLHYIKSGTLVLIIVAVVPILLTSASWAVTGSVTSDVQFQQSITGTPFHEADGFSNCELNEWERVSQEIIIQSDVDDAESDCEVALYGATIKRTYDFSATPGEEGQVTVYSDGPADVRILNGDTEVVNTEIRTNRQFDIKMTEETTVYISGVEGTAIDAVEAGLTPLPDPEVVTKIHDMPEQIILRNGAEADVRVYNLGEEPMRPANLSAAYSGKRYNASAGYTKKVRHVSLSDGSTPRRMAYRGNMVEWELERGIDKTIEPIQPGRFREYEIELNIDAEDPKIVGQPASFYAIAKNESDPQPRKGGLWQPWDREDMWITYADIHSDLAPDRTVHKRTNIFDLNTTNFGTAFKPDATTDFRIDENATDEGFTGATVRSETVSYSPIEASTTRTKPYTHSFRVPGNYTVYSSVTDDDYITQGNDDVMNLSIIHADTRVNISRVNNTKRAGTNASATVSVSNEGNQILPNQPVHLELENPTGTVVYETRFNATNVTTDGLNQTKPYQFKEKLPITRAGEYTLRAAAIDPEFPIGSTDTVTIQGTGVDISTNVDADTVHKDRDFDVNVSFRNTGGEPEAAVDAGIDLATMPNTSSPNSNIKTRHIGWIDSDINVFEETEIRVPRLEPGETYTHSMNFSSDPGVEGDYFVAVDTYATGTTTRRLVGSDTFNVVDADVFVGISASSQFDSYRNTIPVTLNNVGTGDSGPQTVYFEHETPSGTITDAQNLSFSNVPAGSSLTKNVTVEHENPGMHRAHATFGGVTSSSRYQMLWPNLTVSVMPQDTYAQKTVPVPVEISNTGSTYNSNTTAVLEMNATHKYIDIANTTTVSVPPIAPGDTYNTRINGTMPVIANYSTNLAIADPAVEAGSEDTDTTSRVGQGASVTARNIGGGEKADINVTAVNNLDTATGPHSGTVTVSKGGSTVRTVSLTIPELSPYSSETLNILENWNVEKSGTYNVSLSVNSGWPEDQRTHSDSFDVSGAGVDLTVDSVFVGEEITAEAEINNRRGAPTQRTTATIDIIDDTGTVVKSDTAQVPSIPAKTKRSISPTLSTLPRVASSAGSYTARIDINAPNWASNATTDTDSFTATYVDSAVTTEATNISAGETVAGTATLINNQNKSIGPFTGEATVSRNGSTIASESITIRNTSAKSLSRIQILDTTTIESSGEYNTTVSMNTTSIDPAYRSASDSFVATGASVSLDADSVYLSGDASIDATIDNQRDTPTQSTTATVEILDDSGNVTKTDTISIPSVPSKTSETVEVFDEEAMTNTGDYTARIDVAAPRWAAADTTDQDAFAVTYSDGFVQVDASDIQSGDMADVEVSGYNNLDSSVGAFSGTISLTRSGATVATESITIPEIAANSNVTVSAFETTAIRDADSYNVSVNLNAGPWSAAEEADSDTFTATGAAVRLSTNPVFVKEDLEVEASLINRRSTATTATTAEVELLNASGIPIKTKNVSIPAVPSSNVRTISLLTDTDVEESGSYTATIDIDAPRWRPDATKDRDQFNAIWVPSFVDIEAADIKAGQPAAVTATGYNLQDNTSIGPITSNVTLEQPNRTVAQTDITIPEVAPNSNESVSVFDTTQIDLAGSYTTSIDADVSGWTEARKSESTGFDAIGAYVSLSADQVYVKEDTEITGVVHNRRATPTRSTTAEAEILNDSGGVVDSQNVFVPSVAAGETHQLRPFKDTGLDQSGDYRARIDIDAPRWDDGMSNASDRFPVTYSENFVDIEAENIKHGRTGEVYVTGYNLGDDPIGPFNATVSLVKNGSIVKDRNITIPNMSADSSGGMPVFHRDQINVSGDYNAVVSVDAPAWTTAERNDVSAFSVTGPEVNLTADSVFVREPTEIEAIIENPGAIASRNANASVEILNSSGGVVASKNTTVPSVRANSEGIHAVFENKAMSTQGDYTARINISAPRWRDEKTIDTAEFNVTYVEAFVDIEAEDIRAGSETDIEATAYNLQNSSITGFNATTSVTDNGSVIDNETLTFPTVPANSSVNISVLNTTRPDTSGPHTASISAANTNWTTEQREEDEEFIVRGAQLSMEANTVFVKEDAEIRATIDNQRVTPTQPTSGIVEVINDSHDVVASGNVSFRSVPAGDSYFKSVLTDADFDSAGDYTARVRVNASRWADSETVATAPFRVIYTDSFVDIEGGRIRAGDTPSVTATAYNLQGNSSLEGFDSNVTLSRGNTTIAAQNITFPTVAPESNETVSVMDNQRINVSDSYTTTIEANQTNWTHQERVENDSFTAIGPELTMTANTVFVKESPEVDVEIMNRRSTSTKATTATIQMLNESGRAVETRTISIPSIATNTSRILPLFDYYAMPSSGVYNATIDVNAPRWADDETSTREDFEVEQSDAFGDIQANTIQAGREADVQATVHNLQNNSIGPFNATITIRRNGTVLMTPTTTIPEVPANSNQTVDVVNQTLSIAGDHTAEINVSASHWDRDERVDRDKFQVLYTSSGISLSAADIPTEGTPDIVAQGYNAQNTTIGPYNGTASITRDGHLVTRENVTIPEMGPTSYANITILNDTTLSTTDEYQASIDVNASAWKPSQRSDIAMFNTTGVVMNLTGNDVYYSNNAEITATIRNRRLSATTETNATAELLNSSGAVVDTTNLTIPSVLGQSIETVPVFQNRDMDTTGNFTTRIDISAPRWLASQQTGEDDFEVVFSTSHAEITARNISTGQDANMTATLFNEKNSTMSPTNATVAIGHNGSTIANETILTPAVSAKSNTTISVLEDAQINTSQEYNASVTVHKSQWNPSQRTSTDQFTANGVEMEYRADTVFVSQDANMTVEIDNGRVNPSRATTATVRMYDNVTGDLERTETASIPSVPANTTRDVSILENTAMLQSGNYSAEIDVAAPRWADNQAVDDDFFRIVYSPSYVDIDGYDINAGETANISATVYNNQDTSIGPYNATATIRKDGSIVETRSITVPETGPTSETDIDLFNSYQMNNAGIHEANISIDAPTWVPEQRTADDPFDVVGPETTLTTNNIYRDEAINTELKINNKATYATNATNASVTLVNATGTTLTTKTISLPSVSPGTNYTTSLLAGTNLSKPGYYEVIVDVDAPRWGTGESEMRSGFEVVYTDATWTVDGVDTYSKQPTTVSAELANHGTGDLRTDRDTHLIVTGPNGSVVEDTRHNYDIVEAGGSTTKRVSIPANRRGEYDIDLYRTFDNGTETLVANGSFLITYPGMSVVAPDTVTNRDTVDVEIPVYNPTPVSTSSGSVTLTADDMLGNPIVSETVSIPSVSSNSSRVITKGIEVPKVDEYSIEMSGSPFLVKDRMATYSNYGTDALDNGNKTEVVQFNSPDLAVSFQYDNQQVRASETAPAGLLIRNVGNRNASSKTVTIESASGGNSKTRTVELNKSLTPGGAMTRRLNFSFGQPFYDTTVTTTASISTSAFESNDAMSDELDVIVPHLESDIDLVSMGGEDGKSIIRSQPVTMEVTVTNTGGYPSERTRAIVRWLNTRNNRIDLIEKNVPSLASGETKSINIRYTMYGSCWKSTMSCAPGARFSVEENPKTFTATVDAVQNQSYQPTPSLGDEVGGTTITRENIHNFDDSRAQHEWTWKPKPD